MLDQPLTSLSEDGVYEYLGLRDIVERQSADELVHELETVVDQIDASLLAPWQKINAINTSALPSLSFHLRNGVVRKAGLNSLDRKIKKGAKKWLNLPQRANPEI